MNMKEINLCLNFSVYDCYKAQYGICPVEEKKSFKNDRHKCFELYQSLLQKGWISAEEETIYYSESCHRIGGLVDGQHRVCILKHAGMELPRNLPVVKRASCGWCAFSEGRSIRRRIADIFGRDLHIQSGKMIK